jgi:hypothetical protein
MAVISSKNLMIFSCATCATTKIIERCPLHLVEEETKHFLKKISEVSVLVFCTAACFFKPKLRSYPIPLTSSLHFFVRNSLSSKALMMGAFGIHLATKCILFPSLGLVKKEKQYFLDQISTTARLIFLIAALLRFKTLKKSRGKNRVFASLIFILQKDFVSLWQKREKAIALIQIQLGKIEFKEVSNFLKNEKEVVLLAVRKNGMNFLHASKSLQNEEEVILEAIKNDSRVFKYVGEKFKENKQIAIEVIRSNALHLKYVGENLRKDKEIILLAIGHNPMVLKYAGENL